MLALISENILYKYMTRVPSEGEMVKIGCNSEKNLQNVSKGIILFPILYLLNIELIEENEMSSFSNEHIFTLHTLCQDFVFSRD